MPFPLKDIAGQNFQPGSDYLKSVANQARKAYCAYVDLEEGIPDVVETGLSPLRALQKEFVRSVCELPEDPVPLPPSKRLPSNAGKCAGVYYQAKGRGKSPSTGGQTVDYQSGGWGPVSFAQRTFDPGSGTQVQYGFEFQNGTPATGPQPGRITNYFVTGVPDGTSFSVTSITPDPSLSPTDCNRPTLPTDRTSPRSDRQPPTVNIPVPDLPDIVIPVIPVPVPVLPGVRFAPTLVFDVGGINIEFSPGNVEFSFNPQINAPITINNPGGLAPTLPPSVQPVPPPSGRDCCEQLLAEIGAARGQIEIVRAKTIDIQTGVQRVEGVQSGTVVPLLEDIQECVCPKPTRQLAGFTNLQTFTSNEPTSNMAFAQVRIVDGGNKRKTFGVPGGVPVTIAGWYAFGRDGRWGERRPLQFDNNLCLPETRLLTDFTFAVYNGLTASGTVHVEIED